MKTTLKAVLAALALLFLAACSHEPVSGHVTDKSFEAAHTATTQVPQYTTFCRPGPNNTTSCTQQFTHFLPITTNYPDDWDIQIVDIDGKKWWIDVPQDVYDSLSNGDFFDEATLSDGNS